MKYRNLLHIGILAFSLSACMTGKVANSVTTTRISQGAPQPQNTILYALPKTVFNVEVEMVVVPTVWLNVFKGEVLYWI